MSKKTHEPYNKFKGWLRENGVTYSDLSKKMGLNITTISAKINGDSDFLLSEVKMLKREYGLTNEIFLT